jgi:outer membrane protein
MVAMTGVGKLAIFTGAVLLFVARPQPAAAQEETRRAPTAITLADALAYARAHQPQLRASLARVEASRVAADIPRAQWKPQVGATAQLLVGTGNNTTASYLGVAQVPIPRIGGSTGTSAETASLSPSPSTLVGVGGSQEIFDFGRIAAQTAAADALVDATKHDAESAWLDVSFNVEEAYFAVYAAKAVLAASSDAYERAVVHRDYARVNVTAGMRPPIELTRAESDLGRFDVGRVRARGGLAIAQGVLAAAIGSSEPSLDVSGDAPNAADLPSLDDALKRALARDPSVLASMARLGAQEKASTAIGAQLRPDVFLTGTASGRAGGVAPSGTAPKPEGSGWAPVVPNWDVGIVLSWQIFDGTVHARQEASRALELVRREEVDATKQSVRSLVARAYVEAKVARDALPALRQAESAAIANYAQADARFKSGLGNSVELADAEGLRASAEIQLALGMFEVARSRAALGRALSEGL